MSAAADSLFDPMSIMYLSLYDFVFISTPLVLLEVLDLSLHST